MAQKSIKGSFNIAEQIKTRRMQLKMTIEEAAFKAGVGTKTWSRYEAGGSIRVDKCKGICRALNWRFLPSNEEEVYSDEIEDYEKNEAWSEYLASYYGYKAAKSFVVGSELLLDKINQELEELAKQPRYTHLGQISFSLLQDLLPPQFLMQYDYDFVYRLRSELIWLRKGTKQKEGIAYPHTVLQELLYYMCVDEVHTYIDLCGIDVDEDEDEEWDEWIYYLFEDMGLVENLYTIGYVIEDSIYHFSRWNEPVFHLDKIETLNANNE